MALSQNIKEAAFEKHIHDFLVHKHAYRARDGKNDYNREHALDPELFIEFLKSTQSEQYERLQELYGENVDEKIITRLDLEIAKRGVIDVLRNGIEEGPAIKLSCMYFAPVSGKNPEVKELYESNIWSAMRQVYFSPSTEQSVDVALFVNGIPLATVEIKHELNGQTVRNAMNQYRTDRDPEEKLFSFKRCVAHFAVDTEEVYVTTKLARQKTYFLPFNRGNENGAGNPPVENKHKTYYLWENVWSPESWSELLQSFVHVIIETTTDDNGQEYEHEVQIFPRFHQLQTVRSLIEGSVKNGAGSNYLVQHSAGSGKSMTIAWVAYRLAELHNTDDQKVYDTVFVLTDRRVLDKQLRETVENFQRTGGLLYAVREDKAKSAQLKEALEMKARIVTVTVHSFPVVLNILEKMPTGKFALIVDEAHSSQSGEIARSMHEVLGEDALEENENVGDWVLEQMSKRTQPKNLSYFAFTATPKSETLERFGVRNGDVYEPFSLYSMKQAIEEGFILDVLQNYITYKRYFRLLKKTVKDPKLPRYRALVAMLRFVDLHDETIEEKIKIILEHFETIVSGALDGKEKAMLVTSSRESAVRYKLALDAYLKTNGHSYETLVAFSDSITVDGYEYTEPSMNGVSEANTAKEFKKSQYKFLIVAEKYQTGFDEPLLCAMYVDKKLTGVNAVQTLSRLNRNKRDKKSFVLDFKNEADDIRKAFEPYYKTTILSEATDINLLNDTKREILDAYRISDEQLREFAELLGNQNNDIVNSEVNAFLDRVAEDVLRKDEDTIIEFKAKAHFYVKRYPFVALVLGFEPSRDPGAIIYEQLYLFLKYLLKKLPKEGRAPIDISGLADLKFVKITHKKEAHIGLGSPKDDEDKLGADNNIPSGVEQEEDIDTLTKLIEDINKHWGAEFGAEQVETLNKISVELAKDEDLRATASIPNQRSGTELKFGQMFNDRIDDEYDSDKKLYTTLAQNTDLREHVRSRMFDFVFGQLAREKK